MNFHSRVKNVKIVDRSGVVLVPLFQLLQRIIDSIYKNFLGQFGFFGPIDVANNSRYVVFVVPPAINRNGIPVEALPGFLVWKNLITLKLLKM